MKSTAAFLLLIWSTAIVQPSFAYFGGKSAYGNCSKPLVEKKASCKKDKPASSGCNKKKTERPVCSKNKCNNPVKSESKEKCRAEGCNPTLGCSSGNFYVHQHHQIILASWFQKKQKEDPINDNRICKNLSECWHPPEA